MKFVIALVLSFLFRPSFLLTQAQPQDSSSAIAKGDSTTSGTEIQTLLLNGRVLTDANLPPSESAKVVLECGGKDAVAEAHTDSTGYFSITVRVTDSVSTAYPPRKDEEILSANELETCELSAKLAGYLAEPLHVARTGEIGMVDVGTIFLRPIAQGQSQAFVVSVTSLAAPEKAKAAFEKGEEQSKKGKWSSATESFKKAIAVYPKYAIAWLELGRVQAQQSDFANARQSFRQSITQDAKLSDGYVELARLAARQKQWQDLATATDNLVRLHPDVAEYWFLNSAANFNLGNTTQAEGSVTRGMRLDSTHRLPQMEYLYGLILASRRNYQSAAEHVGAYLKLAPQAGDAQEAQERLAEFRELAQAAAHQ